MAVIEMVNGKRNKSGEITTYKTEGSVKRVIDYILNPEKTNEKISGGIYCNTNTAFEEFMLTKALHGKSPVPGQLSNRQVIHFVQSFKEDDPVTPEMAKEIADCLLESEQFKGFQVVYAVHTNTDKIHTHFVINTVNHETGLMWHKSKEDIQAIKDRSDELCREYGLSVIRESEKSKTRRHRSSGEYRAEARGTGWKKNTFDAAMSCKKIAKSREEFVGLMKKLGYEVRWEDTRKDITFTNADGKKINSDKLGHPKKGYTPFTKEALEKQFALNSQVKENQYKSVYESQNIAKKELLASSLIRMGKNIDSKPVKNNPINRRGKLEGAALKEKMKELEKGQGIDWER